MQGRNKVWIWAIVAVALILLVAGGVYFWKQADFRGPIQANIATNQDTFLIGDEMTITLTVRTKSGVTVEIPEKFTLPEGLEILRKSTSKTQHFPGSALHENRYYLTTFNPGEYQLPEITISYKSRDGKQESLVLPGRKIVVKSLLTSDAKDIRELKPLAKGPVNPLVYYIIFGVLVLLGIAYLIYRRWKKHSAPVVETVLPPLPAHVLALQKLDRLHKSDFLTAGEIERYFTVLSSIVREYIENRFAVKAQEMTTQEFLERALRKLELAHEHKKLLEGFLTQSDLVKYARHVPAYEQITGAYETARRFVIETQPVEIVEEGSEDVAQSSL